MNLQEFFFKIFLFFRTLFEDYKLFIVKNKSFNEIYFDLLYSYMRNPGIYFNIIFYWGMFP